MDNPEASLQPSDDPSREFSLRLVLVVLLLVLIAGGSLAGGSGLAIALCAATLWAIWAGSLLWSEAHGLGDDLVRAGLVALYPAGVASVWSAANPDAVRWLADQPMTVVPPGLAVLFTSGGLSALAALGVRARAKRLVEEAPPASPARHYAAGIAITITLVGLAAHLFLGTAATPLLTFGLGLSASFVVTLVLSLVQSELDRRAMPRHLALVLVLPCALFGAGLLLYVIHLNRPETLLRTYLGGIPAGARDLRVDAIDRTGFSSQCQVSFAIDPPDLHREIAKRGFKLVAQTRSPEPTRYLRSGTEDWVELVLSKKTDRVVLIASEGRLPR